MLTYREVISCFRNSEEGLEQLQRITLKSTEHLVSQPHQVLSDLELLTLKRLLEHLHQGWPLAYFWGESYFNGLVFKVNPHCLIPRPTTEILLNVALELINQHNPAHVVDLGTGSGNVIISIALLHPTLSLEAWDCSLEALKIAQENNSLHKVSVNLCHRSWWDDIQPRSINGLVVSNPPYVDYAMATKSLAAEPDVALYSKNHGLADIYRIINIAPMLGSILVLEVSPEQEIKLSKHLTSLTNVISFNTVKDLLGVCRVFVIRFKIYD